MTRRIPEQSEFSRHCRIMATASGFSMIEALLTISLLSIAFMALASGIWAASKSARVTHFGDESIMTGQDLVEMLSVVDIEEVTATPPGQPISRGDQKIVLQVVDTADPDNDGRIDFKTIAIQVYHSADDTLTADELRLKSYYRRRVY